jgi:hypothetical protein
MSCRAKRAYHWAWLGRAKWVMSCPPNGLPVRPKHGPTHASDWPGPVTCRARARPNHAGRGLAHLPRAKFSGLLSFFLFPASRSRPSPPRPSPPRPDSARPRPSRLRLSPSRHRLALRALRAQGWRTTHARLAIGLVWSLFELLTSLPLEPGANLASLIWYGWYSAVKRLYLFVIFLNKYRYPSQNSEWSSCFFIQRTILKYRCSVFLKLRLGSFKFL